MKESLGVAGVSLAGLGAAATVFPMGPGWFPMVGMVGGIAITAYGFYQDHYSNLEKIFLNCNLFTRTINDTIMLPRKLKVIHKKTGKDIILTLPQGLCLDDFKKKEQHITQALDKQVSFDFNNGILIMSIQDKKLGTMYPFELIETKKPLEVCFAYDINGPYIFDIEEAIHTLIAGSTGAGKSVLLRSLVTALILGKKQEDVKLHLVDFMRVELGIFKRSSMVSGFYTSPEQFSELLENTRIESQSRLDLFESKDLVNIISWNKKCPKRKLPYIIVIVDEFAALQKHKKILTQVTERTAQDRKCGIHYILCTQRPSVDIVPGPIKVNVPTRIALKLSTDTDSQVILDQNGAEKLRKKGHALVKMDDLDEIQVMYLSEDEAFKMVKHTFVNKNKVIVQEPARKSKGVMEIGS